MRVLIAPDSFGDTLTAVQAAAAIASGWAQARPDDEVTCAPLSDGGPGFVDVLATSLGQVVTTTVRGPTGDPVDARWLLDDPQVVTAYIECAEACGLHHLRPPSPRTAVAATTAGVGDLVVAALSRGAERIVVGLGGSGSTDGGAGLLEALSGTPSADHRAARDRLGTVELIVATDVENPLLGPSGAAVVFGPQKGADRATVDLLERRMIEWNATLSELAGRDVADEAGAGAAGGLGAALLALGGRRESGATMIAEAIGLTRLVAASDVLVTGEGKFDHQTLQGKVVAAAAGLAAHQAVPTIVLAGQVALTPAQIASAGIVQARGIVDIADSVEHAMAQAAPLLTELARQAGVAWRRE